MIGEPELEGAWTDGRPAEFAADEPAERPPRARAPWRWALGGAVTASVVWAGALVLQERYVEAGPPIRYRQSEQLCAETPLKSVAAATGEFGVGMPSHGESSALDWSFCYSTGGRGSNPFTHMAEVLVELHKKADPATEFGFHPELNPDLRSPSVPVEQVPGLGERAVFSGKAQAPRLQVLDGGAVFTLTVQWWEGDGETRSGVDGDAVKTAMVEDVRALMARLRT
ncbi:hypothetical protein AB0F18_31825 [Streptomyces sp. NPDC029216]|uniref:hypothetical protein n=1 Tax=Streptomyces sp. NPDC029216 TaxID=3154701 RepID=UPI003405C4A2